MDFSKLSSSERMASVAAVVVVVTSLISIARDWGTLMFIALLTGVAALVVIFAPQIMPNTKMPGSNGSFLTVLGGATVLVWIVVLIDNLGWVGDHIVHWDTLQFFIGLIAAIALTWYGWAMLQSEGGKFQFGSQGSAAAPPPPPAADPSATGAPPAPAPPAENAGSAAPPATPPPAAPPPAAAPPASPPPAAPPAESGSETSPEDEGGTPA